jgi:tetratricopeptide (TPR) repeat protein
MLKRLIKFTVPLVYLLLLGYPTLASNELKNGIANFNQAQYLDALSELLLAAHADPSSAITHYYLANTLAHLGQEEGAQEEYKLAYLHSSPHSQVARYCTEALLAYEKQHQSQTNHQLVKQMVFQIQEQVNNKKSDISTDTQTLVSSANQLGFIRKQIIEDRVNKDIFFLTGGFHSWRLEPQVQALRQQADLEYQIANLDTERRTTRLNQEGESKLVSIENSASNLENQLLHPSTNGAQLSPLGTNLYIRNYLYNYDQTNMDNTPTPLVAQAKKLALTKGHTKPIPHNFHTAIQSTKVSP